MSKPEAMSQPTYERLNQELKRLEQRHAEMSADRGSYFDNAADWHDNGPLDALEQELRTMEAQILTLRDATADPQIIEPRRETDYIGVGNTVLVQFDDEDEPERFTVLGRHDSGTNPNWISSESPLGTSLIGARPGANIIYTVERRQMGVRVVNIFPGEFPGKR